MANYENALPALEQLRDVLGAVTWGAGNTVKTARIGLEAGLSPVDYPMVRVVPSRVQPSDLSDIPGLRQREALVYFGLPIAEADDGLETLWAELFDMELALVNALPTYGDWVARWEETITDEDRVPGYKLMALRVLVDG